MKISELVSVFKSTIIPNSNVRKVFKLLGKDDEGVPHHLHLLNPNSFDEERSTIDKCKNIAISLKDKPEKVGELVRELNWRPTLVGNTLAILLREHRVQKDMIWRLEKGTWVSPQLSVGIALLNDGSAEKELKRIIESATEDSNPGTIMSAYSSLVFLESQAAELFKQTTLFKKLREKDSRNNSIEIAQKHWDFWKSIDPV